MLFLFALVFQAVFQGCHAEVLLHVFAEEGGGGKFQVISNLLHGHAGEAQTSFDGIDGVEGDHVTWPPTDGFHEDA